MRKYPYQVKYFNQIRIAKLGYTFFLITKTLLQPIPSKNSVKFLLQILSVDMLSKLTKKKKNQVPGTA